MQKNKKLILIGDDGAIPEVVLKFKEKLPNMRKMIERGIFAPTIPSPPVDTPTNWTSIATGAWTKTHGINGFNVHLPGEHLEKNYPTLNSKFCQAEYLWESAERGKKRSILLNYPVAWPFKTKKSIIVGGDNIFVSPHWRLSSLDCYVTPGVDSNNGTLVVNFTAAKNWKNLPSSNPPSLESRIPLQAETEMTWTKDGLRRGGETKRKERLFYYLLLISSDNKGYDTLIITKNKDIKSEVCRLKVGEWSPWIKDNFVKNKKRVEGTFKFRLINLSADGKRFKLFRTSAEALQGWAYPENIVNELNEIVGPYHEGLELNAVFGLLLEWFNEEIFFELAYMQAKWLIKSAEYLTHNYDWNLLLIQIHIQDAINHMFLGYLDKNSPIYEEKKAEKVWDFFLKSHQVTDRMIGGITNKCSNSNTIVMFVSDHGCIPVYRKVFLLGEMVNKGLYVIKKNRGKLETDWTKTKLTIGYNIWINLKGRDPEGVVNPGKEYELIRDKIINILISLRDPETKECPVAMAIRKEDSSMLGLGGERVGDIVFFMKPGYWNIGLWEFENDWDKALLFIKRKGIFETTEPNTFRTATHEFLPGTKLGGFSNRGVFIMSGPGIPESLRYDSINIVDIAPTIAHLTNIPYPLNAEGKVLRW